MANKIGKRDNAAKIKHGVGGKAFPSDFNWVCRECGRENRSFETTCGYCEHEAQLEKGAY